MNNLHTNSAKHKWSIDLRFYDWLEDRCYFVQTIIFMPIYIFVMGIIVIVIPFVGSIILFLAYLGITDLLGADVDWQELWKCNTTNECGCYD